MTGHGIKQHCVSIMFFSFENQPKLSKGVVKLSKGGVKETFYETGLRA